MTQTLRGGHSIFWRDIARNSHVTYVTYARYKPGEEIVFSYGDKDFCANHFSGCLERTSKFFRAG